MQLLRVGKTTLLALGLALLAFATVAPPAGARDLSTRLADAEQRVSSVETEISERQQHLETAEARYEAAAERAEPVDQASRRAKARVQRLRRALTAREQRATTRISQLEAQRQQEVDDHDRDVRNGVGLGLAALIAAGIAIGWGWFRASAAVAALSDMDLSQAIGLCVGGGFLLLVGGAALGSSDGTVGVLGSFIFCLGLILPIALLLGRHSAEVQRGRSKPLAGRKRLPAWVPRTIAALMLVVFAASTGSAIFADGASSQPVPGHLREEAAAMSKGSGAEELAGAMEEAAESRRAAAGPLAMRSAARKALAGARRGLRGAERRLTRAESSLQYFNRRLVALEERERREAAKAAEQAQREEDELLEQEEEEFASECNPNYSGCLDPYSSDYDCAGGSGDGPDYTGTVEVTGYDEYGLDDDGDGIGCDP